MSPYSCALLLQIRPILMAAITRGAVRPTGCEDAEELVQDGMVMAANQISSADQRGVTITASTTAFFTLQGLKSGRRAGSACRKDVMCPAAQLDSTVKVDSMDAGLGVDDGGHEMTLHDYLAGSAEDPAGVVGRVLDWEQVMERLDPREQFVVNQTALDTPGTAVARRLRISTPRVVQIKRRVAQKIKDAWGEDAVMNVVRETTWQRHVRTMAERRACRAERRAA